MDEQDKKATEDEMQAQNDLDFQHEIEQIIQKAEDVRLKKMRAHRDRTMVVTTLTLLLICLGSVLFGWFLLVAGDIALALLFLMCTIIPPVFFSSWAHEPIRDYIKQHKTVFMPAMAKALGGLTFHPRRGIGKNVLQRTGIVPKHKDYRAEDCFMGRYKGMKIMLSEARLTHPQKRREFSFHGIFVLIEASNPVFEGHSVLTADRALAKRLQQKLKGVPLPQTPYSNEFEAYSSKPENVGQFLDNTMIREFGEMRDLFNKSPLSAAFFKGKYIFVMIPYNEDMFEASNVFVPVTTSDAAMKCKREVDQILSIIDILDRLGTGP